MYTLPQYNNVNKLHCCKNKKVTQMDNLVFIVLKNACILIQSFSPLWCLKYRLNRLFSSFF